MSMTSKVKFPSFLSKKESKEKQPEEVIVPNAQISLEKVGSKNNPIVWKMPPLPESAERLNVLTYREPVITYCITPNNAPIELNEYGFNPNIRNKNKRSMKGDDVTNLLMTTIHSLYEKFYPPHRIRFTKKGIKVRLNDVVSFKVSLVDGVMKFYLTVPKKWSKSFVTAAKSDWGEVDITEVPNCIIDFNPSHTEAMEMQMTQHYGLSFKNDISEKDDSFMTSLASLASTLTQGDKVLIDYNISPVNDMWKPKATNKVKVFKDGKIPQREDDYSPRGLLKKCFDVINIVLDETLLLISEILEVDKEKVLGEKEPFELKYSSEKTNASSRGYKVQIRVLGESKDKKKVKHAFKSIETAFSLLDGDNSYKSHVIKSKKGIEKEIKAVQENKPLPLRAPDIYYEKELKNLVKLPAQETLQEFKKVIDQDGFTRSEIDEAFFEDADGAIPFAYTLDKEPKKLFMGGYKREDWTPKGRYAKNKGRLDDRSTSTMLFGGMGSGKTSLSENQICYTFGAHIEDYEQWKRESKSVLVFDVADGAMIRNVLKRIPEDRMNRVIILNHSNFKNPIAVNNADLAEYNEKVMKDEDYAFTLAEMEASLMVEILGADKVIAMDRWFRVALQAVHEADKDFGYIEAMRVLTDTDFRMEEVLPKLKNKRLIADLKIYNTMSSDGRADRIIETIQNRFSQIESDQKLWDCIAQRPLRDEEGNVKLNFRKWMDGDEGGAYLVLIYIPKSGVSQLYRKFIFAQYFTKIWNAGLSREAGFGGREYRPETLVVMDEIHQIIDIPIVSRLFIDIFKEPRKYSLRYWFTLHGWSSLAAAGRGVDKKIEQSIKDNGCNLIMLKGGEDAFKSLKNFLEPMTPADFNNLMNMEYCGIFALRWANKNHVMQARLLEHLDSKKSIFKVHRKVDSNFLQDFASDYGRDKEWVRDDNFERGYSLIEKSAMIGYDTELKVGEDEWKEAVSIGMKEKKSKK